MIPLGAKIPHFRGDNQDSAKTEEDNTKEEASSAAEEANSMIKGLVIEAEAPQVGEEGMTMVIMDTATPTTLEIEVDRSKDDHGGRGVSNQEEEDIHRKREQETQNIGVYRSISIYVVYVEIKATMTISAIPYNIWLMLYKANKHRDITLYTTHLNLKTIMTNRLFRVGIPKP